MQKIIGLVTILALGLSSSTTLSARTWQVPGDANTIAAGLDSAQVGDVVSIACGIYYEHDITLKPGVVLRSSTGDSTCVTIDAEYLGRVLVCPAGTTPATLIGLTLRNGQVDSTSVGGGILCESGLLELEQCLITECEAYDGGGLYCGVGSSVTLDGCHISNNGSGGVSANGAGLTMSVCEIFQNSDYGVANNSTTDTLTVTQCSIMGNGGPGVTGGWMSPIHLIECQVSRNEGPGVWAGDSWVEDCSIMQNSYGGIYGTNARISGTSIQGNSTPYWGGGVLLLSPTSASITNCTIGGNTARIDGGGVFSSGSGEIDMTGSVISGNSILVGTDCSDTTVVATLPDDVAGGCAPHKWTILVYLNGDNYDLEDEAIGDFQKLASVGSDDNVNIVVLFDRSAVADTRCGDWTSGKLFIVHQGQVPSPSNQFLDMGETDMGSPGQLATFVYQAAGFYPAEHYALIVWDHGSAWTKKSKSLLDGSGSYHGASSDDESGNEISFAEGEFRQAFQMITQLLGQKLDIIAFDTCLNQMVECANEGLGYCDYWVGSEELAYGFRYDVFLQQLKDANGDLSPLAFSRAIVEANDTHPRQNTLSSLDMTMLPPLVAALDTLSIQLSDAMASGYRYAILAAMDSSFLFQACRGNQPDLQSRDLLSFTEELLSVGMPAAVNAATSDVQDAIATLVVSNSTINDDATTCDYDSVGGIAIYISASYDTLYSGLEFAKKTHWDDFLIALSGTTGIGPPPDEDDSTRQDTSPEALSLLVKPSPFMSHVQMEYAAPRGSAGTISIYDVGGRLIRQLAVPGDTGTVSALTWDGRDARGQQAASGMYFFRLDAGGQRVMRKALLIR